MTPDTPSSAASGMGADHERIWLEPRTPDDRYGHEGRTWCQDKVWPTEWDDAEPTEYVRADLYAAKDRELAEARERCQMWFDTHDAHRKACDALGKANGELMKRAMDAERRATTAERERDEAMAALREKEEVLLLTAGALQVGQRVMPREVIFNGEWAHLGKHRVSDILDKADAVLAPVSREQRGEEA